MTVVDTFVYTFVMARRAKIFTNGGSQAVRLPKEVRFPDTQREVTVRRHGRSVILEPADEWTPEFIAALGSWPEPIERPKKRRIGNEQDPFA
jgi:antitoxin VapB